MVLRGKDRGKTGQIMGVIKLNRKVLVEGVNMVMKHIKPKRSGEKGQRVSVASPLHLSNVQLVCPSCKKRTRVAVKRDQGRGQRICKKCQAVIS